MSDWTDGDLAHLHGLAVERAKTEAAIRAQVSHLRQLECPWSMIGNALGVRKQAAQQRYGSQRVSFVDRVLGPEYGPDASPDSP